MSESMPMMLIALGGELLLVVLVLLSVSWWRQRARRIADGKAVKALVARAREGKAEREAAIEKFLADRMGLSGEALMQAKGGMLRGELALLQRFATVYKKRDAGAASRFHGDLFAALEPYHALQAPTAAEPVDLPNPAELEFLHGENKRLSEELRAAMEAMSRMLSEYSRMFAAGKVGGSPPGPTLTRAAEAAVAADVPPDDDTAEIAEATPAHETDADLDVAVAVGVEPEAAEAAVALQDEEDDLSGTSSDTGPASGVTATQTGQSAEPAGATDETAGRDGMVERDGPAAEAEIPTLAEEEAEVIAFDGDEDLDVETMAVDEDDLIDPVAVDAVRESQPYFDDVTAVEAVVQADADGAGVEQTERPLKTRAGG